MSNMYPDLNEEDNKGAQPTYQATTTTTTAQTKKKKEEQQEEKDNCCLAGAKFWISLIGALNLVRFCILCVVNAHIVLTNDFAIPASWIVRGGDLNVRQIRIRRLRPVERITPLWWDLDDLRIWGCTRALLHCSLAGEV